MADDVSKSLQEVREHVGRHDERLANGQKAFEQMRQEHTRMAEAFAEKLAALTPQPPSTLKVVSITLAIVMAGGGAVWATASMFGDRPTRAEVREGISAAEADIESTRTELRGVRDLQIKNNEKLGELEKKLDSIAEKLTDAPPRRRR